MFLYRKLESSKNESGKVFWAPDSLQILRTKVSDRNIGHGNVLKYKFLFYVVKKQKVSDFYLGHLVCMIHVTRVTKLLNLTQILINTRHKHTRKSMSENDRNQQLITWLNTSLFSCSQLKVVHWTNFTMRNTCKNISPKAVNLTDFFPSTRRNLCPANGLAMSVYYITCH